MTTDKHHWRFYRAGGVDQVLLRDGRDLVHLAELDPKLWVALAMPTRGVCFDARTLAAIDTDHDGRIRMPEILAAVGWALAALVRPDDLVQGGDSLAVDAIADPALRAGAERVLANLGRAGASSIALGDVADTAKLFAATRFNGDGVIPADAADEPVARQLIEDVLATGAPVIDRSGKPGIDGPRLDRFFTEVAALAAWDAGSAAALVLGADTPAAAADTRAVRVKIDDYFVSCRLAALDGTGTAFGGFAALAAQRPEPAQVAALPLARVEAGRPLPLERDQLNPAWSDAVLAFARSVVVPVLGPRPALDFDAWQDLSTRLAPYEAWRAARPVCAVEKLGLERVRALAASDARARVAELIARDLALAPENAQLQQVEKLLLFHRDLFRLLNNFVSFSDFYGRRGAVFQAGTLFLDGRACSLCVEVVDPGKHATLAAMSGAYLAYCDCTRPNGDKLQVVAAFTDGDSDNLLVGRNGVLFDRQGRDWDATISKIVANPISIREAFWAPYKKLARLIEEQLGKRAAAAEAESSARIARTAEEVAAADTAKPAAAPARTKIDVGTVAAIGVAVGGIGAMVTGVLAAFFDLGFWMPLGLLAALLLISGPSMLLAFLKLRQRNLGPLLDANGWAINGRARINVPFGGALTDLARLPPGAQRSLEDPYAEKSRPWALYTVLLVILALGLAWYLGRLDDLLPPPAQSVHVLGAMAPGSPP